MAIISYNINKNSEPIGELNYIVSNGILNNINDFLIFDYTSPINDINSNIELQLNITSNSTYKVEIAWSYDHSTYTNYVLYNSNTFNNFNYNVNTWFKIKITQLTSGNIIINNGKLIWNRNIRLANNNFILNQNEIKIIKPDDIYKIFEINDVVVITKPNLSILDISFRYTQTNGRTWSKWIPFTKDGITTTRFSSLFFTKFEFTIENNNAQSVTLLDLDIIGRFSNISKKYLDSSRLGLRTDCLGYTEDIVDPFNENSASCDPCNDTATKYITCDTKPTFNPYATGKLGSFFEYLNNSISDIWGKNVHYFKHTPDEDNVDYDLHEYPIMNVEENDFKEIKVIVPKNQFPNNEIKFTGFNLDLFETFEIHITKDEFKNAFGIEERPGKKDVLLFCELNRLYEVEHILAARGALNMSTYYRVVLKKYTKDANTSFIDNAADLSIAGLTANGTLDNLFKTPLAESNQNIKSTNQLSPITSNIFDRRLDKLTIIEQLDIYNGKSLLATSVYKIPYSKNKNFIYFTGGDSRMTISENRSINLWFNVDEYDSTYIFNLIQNIYSNNGYEVLLTNNKLIFNLNDGSFNVNFIPTPNIWYLLSINIDQINNKLILSIYKRQSEYGNDYNDQQMINIVYKEYDHEPKLYQHSGGFILGGVTTNNKSKSNIYITGLKVLNMSLEQSDIFNINSLKIINNDYKLLLSDNADNNLTLPKIGNI